MSKINLYANVNRIQQDIETLATFIDQSKPGHTRKAFTSSYQQGRQWLKEQMEACGLQVKMDAASNLIGSLPGRNPNLAPLMIGSHIDTVTGGGRFDGIIGVLAGLEIVRLFKEAGIQLEHSLEIVDFTAEEASEFGIATIGSRGMVDNLSKEMFEYKDSSGLSLKEALRLAGGQPEQISAQARKQGDVALYLELHIEQGPFLEQTAYKLGVVTGIVGIHRYRVTVEGKPNHAGATPMNMRYDALAGAVHVISSLESISREQYTEPVVGTIGKLSLHPNAANVIPGKVIFDLEVRSLDTSILEEMIQRLQQRATEIAAERKLAIHFDCLSTSESIRVQPEIQAVIEEACRQTASTTHLPSGAGHDGHQLARICPIGMIFVPSKDGRSHCPEEWTEYSDVALGVEALARSIVLFDQKL